MCFANSHGIDVGGHQVLLHACSLLYIVCMLLLLMLLLLLLHLIMVDAACSPEQKQRKPPRRYCVKAILHLVQHALLLTCCLVCYSSVQRAQPVRDTPTTDGRQVSSMAFLLHSTAACKHQMETKGTVPLTSQQTFLLCSLGSMSLTHPLTAPMPSGTQQKE